ncbi:hypothetical protein F0562_007370 [Nyssa sinensis]|uniref:Conserved oligomeric Golgi complex subunit 5 N-terminal domain-containing protein n=1 Tax=Nyssa sinensis TaxID=561372 RepID=A0A5J5A371_9ASTE|nr:hypothetical protein F0562_007370 [Nyssa sinensis]
MASPVIQRSPVPSSSFPLQRLSTFKDRTTNTPTLAIATPQSSITPATAPLSLSSPLDSFASDPIFSAFLSPDFDSTRFSSAALSSGSVAARAEKLQDGICLLEKQLRSEVFSRHHDLLSQLSSLKDAYSALAALRFAVSNLQSSVRRVHSEILQRYGCRKLSRLENLEVLDLGGNDFNNSILPCLSAISTLKNLSLDSNSLEGLFPIQEFSHLKNLEALDISYNKIRGSLSFKELATLGNMVTLDLCGNQLSKVSSIEAMSSLKALSFYYNKLSDFSIFQGEQEEVEFTTKSRTYSYGGNILNFMSGLDLSCNQLTGEIPTQLGDLSGILALNLSHNHLNGSIPVSLAMLKQIESLDLSYNSLSGEIPSQLADLNFLAIFNVSYNKLSGRTPEKGQFATFDESNYEGNPDLCGPLLKRSCSSTAAPPTPSSDGEKNDTAIDMEDFYWSFMASYIIVLSALLVILCINPSWRRAWFRLIHLWILRCFIQY